MCTLDFSRSGYDALKMRKAYSTKGEETYVKDFVGSNSWEISKSEFSNIKEVEASPKETHQITFNNHADVAGETMYLNPLLGFELSENPFKADSRQYPVDFGSPYERIIMSKIEIPDGFTVDEMPPSKIFALPGGAGRFLYNAGIAGNTINVTVSLTINKALFVQNDYPYLREFYSQVVAKQAEQVVLKKK